MKSKFHTSRMFRSVNTLPTPEDISMRQFPIAETFNDVCQETGEAEIRLWPSGPNYEVSFNIIRPCGDRITHWRWK